MAEVWLDEIPYEPPLEDCVRCGNPLRSGESAYVAYVRGVHFWPLHRECFEVLDAL